MAKTARLKGMCCPQCGSYGDFLVVTKCYTVLKEDGSQHFTDYEIDKKGECECSTCGFLGKVPDFRKSRRPNRLEKRTFTTEDEEEQLRRDEKNGLYPDKVDVAN